MSSFKKISNQNPPLKINTAVWFKQKLQFCNEHRLKLKFARQHTSVTIFKVWLLRNRVNPRHPCEGPGLTTWVGSETPGRVSVTRFVDRSSLTGKCWIIGYFQCGVAPACTCSRRRIQVAWELVSGDITRPGGPILIRECPDIIPSLTGRHQRHSTLAGQSRTRSHNMACNCYSTLLCQCNNGPDPGAS